MTRRSPSARKGATFRVLSHQAWTQESSRTKGGVHVDRSPTRAARVRVWSSSCPASARDRPLGVVSRYCWRADVRAKHAQRSSLWCDLLEGDQYQESTTHKDRNAPGVRGTPRSPLALSAKRLLYSQSNSDISCRCLEKGMSRLPCLRSPMQQEPGGRKPVRKTFERIFYCIFAKL